VVDKPATSTGEAVVGSDIPVDEIGNIGDNDNTLVRVIVDATDGQLSDWCAD